MFVCIAGTNISSSATSQATLDVILCSLQKCYKWPVWIVTLQLGCWWQ